MRLAQQQGIQLTAVAVKDVPVSVSQPTWRKVPIENWGDDERADEPLADPDARHLVKVKSALSQMNREWQTGLDAGKQVDWPHYFRWANNLWYETGILREQPQLEPTRMQAKSAIIAVYDAMTRASQTGEKQTPERTEGNRQVIALMAAMIGGGL